MLLGRRRLVLGAAAATACASAGSRGRPGAPEVVIMGMIHGGHRTSPRYGLDVVRRLIRAIRPDHVLTEIPPDRFPMAMRQHRAGEVVTEPRVAVFPEYTDAVFPLEKELGYEIVPCSGWTRALADRRRELTLRWKEERPEETAEVEAARKRMDRRLRDGHRADDPAWIHTDAYDRIVREGMEPADRLWNDDLGPGGWSNINRAHVALIEAAVDARLAPGKRFLVTFGAWHKHWIRRELGRRTDLHLLPLHTFL